jgi:membrane protease YdiL (CAAX protease family)
MLGFLSWKTGSVLPSLILHGLNNTMAMIFSFSEAGDGNIYIWNGHVAPWIIIIALACAVTGFKVLNGLRVQA